MPKRTVSSRKWRWMPPGKTVECDAPAQRQQFLETSIARGALPHEWNRAARRCYAAYTKKKARAEARRAK